MESFTDECCECYFPKPRKTKEEKKAEKVVVERAPLTKEQLEEREKQAKAKAEKAERAAARELRKAEKREQKMRERNGNMVTDVDCAT
jgi:cbb3-type cytochrome oxidase cytochrome c subunit